MLQRCVPNVSSVFSDVCCMCFIWMLHMFHTKFVSVSFRCCICFIWMLHMFYNGYTRVFWCFQTYVAKCFRRILQVFSSRCCKSRSVVCTCSSGTHLLQPLALLGLSACMWVWRGGSGRHGKWCDCRSRAPPVWARVVGVGNRVAWAPT
jgi:hypothetical protein